MTAITSIARLARATPTWPERTFWNGVYKPIRELISDGSHGVELHGNSAEGWAVYLFSKSLPNVVLQVSPLFSRDFGDTRRDCLEACERAYGVRPKHTVKYLL